MQGKKTGGRVAGTPNKVTTDLRKMLKAAVAREFESLPETLGQLPPRERVELLAKLLPFCLPKVGPIESNYDTCLFNLNDE